MNFSIRKELEENERKLLDKYSDKVAKLLFHRGILTNESAEVFFNGDYELHQHNPFLLKDMEKVVGEILDAISNNKRICVFSDYDADGIPGAVIFSDFLKKIGYENFFNYIPHRNKEGFGLNLGAIKKIKDENTDLIITIDCGITDIEPIKLANELWMKVIVTDHHEPGIILPEAFAIIDPKQHDCNYPFDGLCGSGVIFKVVQALIQKGNFEIPKGWEKWLLDMVGIATLADMVPLQDENRIFAKYGLFVLKKTRRKGLMKLYKDCKLQEKNICEDDIGFTIAPRINAASRMDEPELAFKMLSTDDDIVAGETVKKLNKINDERKGVVASMVKEIKHHLNGLEKIESIVVKGNPNWQPSLLGLAASSIVESYKRPAFLWGKGEGSNFKGSCRSDGSVSLVEMMQNVGDGVIYEFGGHEMAGGFAVHEKAIFDLESELVNAFEKVKNKDHKELTEVIVDEEIGLEDINWKFFNEMNKLAPFGVGNAKPVFFLKNVKIFDIQKFGKAKEHIKVQFKSEKNGIISAIKFFAEELKIDEKHKVGDSVNLIAFMEKSTFGYTNELRLRLLHLFN